MAMWSARKLVAHGGLVVIAVPTIGLVAQTVRVWKSEYDRLDVLAVCGDHSVAGDDESDDEDEEGFGTIEDILDPVTTDPDVVAAWLHRPCHADVRLLVVTHVSCHVAGEGMQQARSSAELLIVDEAHRSAGAAHKHAALLHDDDVLPARRRLYMTATPRVFTRPTDVQASDVRVLSMDDESVFGPVLYNYPFSRAIKDGYLDDYRLAIIGVTKAEVRAMLRRLARARGAASDPPLEHTAMVQAAVARAASELDLRSLIAFCPRIRDAELFAETFDRTLDALPTRLKPARPLAAAHVHSGMNQDQRDQALGLLAAPPDNGWSVVSNARCLAEGIDVPAVDAIAFTAPKRSTVEIVQAVGRALRLHPDGNGTATIIVPILLPENYGGTEAAIDPAEFEILWEVVRALRSHDDTFAHALDTFRANGFTGDGVLDRVTFSLPKKFQTPTFLEHLTIHIVQSSTSPWWDKYAVLADYYREHGDTRVPLTEKYRGVNLGRWVSKTRTAYRAGRLSADQKAALDKIEFLSHIHDAAWEAFLDALRQHKTETGHLDVPRDLVSRVGTNVHQSLTHQRVLYRRGTLLPGRAKALMDLGVDFRDQYDARRGDIMAALRRYHAEHGDIFVPVGFRSEEGRDVNVWLQYQRRRRVDGELPADQEAELDELGMEWEKLGVVWGRTKKRIRAFYGRVGTVNIPFSDAKDDPDPNVVYLVRLFRQQYRRGALPSHKVEFLESLGIDWEYNGTKSDPFLRAAHDYVARNGRLDPDPDYVTADGVELGAWLQEQRHRHAVGKMGDQRRQVLEQMGVELVKVDPYTQRWRRAIHELELHLRAGNPVETISGQTETATGFPIGRWLSDQRHRHRQGKLPSELVAALRELNALERPPRRPRPSLDAQASRKPKVSGWELRLATLRDAHKRHGHLYLRQKDDPKVARLMVALRFEHRHDRPLKPTQLAALDELDFPWDGQAVTWGRYFVAARTFYAENGHLDVPKVTPDGRASSLHTWLNQQRTARQENSLDPRCVAMLDEVGMRWEVSGARALYEAELDARWEEMFDLLHAACVRLGPDRVTLRSVAQEGGDPELRRIVRWLDSQRTAFKDGRLRADREHRLRSLGLRLTTGKKAR